MPRASSYHVHPLYIDISAVSWHNQKDYFEDMQVVDVCVFVVVDRFVMTRLIYSALVKQVEPFPVWYGN